MTNGALLRYLQPFLVRDLDAGPEVSLERNKTGHILTTLAVSRDSPSGPDLFRPARPSA